MGVLVAGGTGALGGAVVRELLDSAYDVTATWIVESERERIESELGGRVDLVRGFKAGAKVHEADPADLDRMLTLNVRTAYMLARAAMPRLAERGGGAFIAVSARAAVRPFPGAAAYVASKAAV